MRTRYRRRIEPRRYKRLMQRFEEVRFSQHSRDSVAVHIGSQVLIDARKQHVDTALLQTLAEFTERPGR